ncbi:MAG TPA: DnaJ domain-containing protein [Dehalococcoidia bacterium]|nr:DnaJ domain-containing protein [Dehalococcoidia bacterium]
MAAEDYYETLQVSPHADPEVIEAAYRVLARRVHPDRNPSPAATAAMARLNAAWETLRAPERRAAYDAQRQAALDGPRAGGATSGMTRTATAPTGGTAARERGGGPRLYVEPAALQLGPLPRGGRGAIAAAVATEPPGIRVETAVAGGAGWLTVGPPLLEGLEKEQIGVAVNARGLAPGRYRGAVLLRTSWETVTLPVELSVRRASPLFAVRTLLTAGPGEGGWRGGAALLLLALTTLLAIVVALGVLALGR